MLKSQDDELAAIRSGAAAEASVAGSSVQAALNKACSPPLKPAGAAHVCCCRARRCSLPLNAWASSSAHWDWRRTSTVRTLCGSKASSSLPREPD